MSEPVCTVTIPRSAYQTLEFTLMQHLSVLRLLHEQNPEYWGVRYRSLERCVESIKPHLITFTEPGYRA